MRLTVIGCGDAFGSGGRLQTSFHVASGAGEFLIDCGATTLIGCARAGIAPNSVGTILISHLHGDHFGGLVWWLLHAQHISKRTAPLTIAGPPGIEERFTRTSEALFPGSTTEPRRFHVRWSEMSAGQASSIGALTVRPFDVSHPSGAPSHALRIETAGRTIAFSGDTEWVEALVECACDTDLFITECYAFERASRYHMNWRTLAANLPRLRARRIMLTHMNAEMLAHTDEARAAGVLVAEDGLAIDV